MLVYPPRDEDKLRYLRKEKEQLRKEKEQLRKKEEQLQEKEILLLQKRFGGGKYNGTICSVHKQSNCACIVTVHSPCQCTIVVPDDGECTRAQSSALTREESAQSTGKIMKV